MLLNDVSEFIETVWRGRDAGVIHKGRVSSQPPSRNGATRTNVIHCGPPSLSINALKSSQRYLPQHQLFYPTLSYSMPTTFTTWYYPRNVKSWKLLPMTLVFDQCGWKEFEGTFIEKLTFWSWQTLHVPGLSSGIALSTIPGITWATVISTPISCAGRESVGWGAHLKRGTFEEIP